MATECNGLLLFPSQEDHSDHPAIRELAEASLGDVRFLYGFFSRRKATGLTPFRLRLTNERRSCSTSFRNRVPTSPAQGLHTRW